MTEENEMKKKYLMRYRQMTRAVERIEEQIKDLRREKMNPAYIITNMPHGGNGVKDLSGYAAKLDELISMLVQTKYNRISAYTEIQKQIEMVPDEVEQELLFFRYIKGYSFSQIADAMEYSFRNVTRIHGKALEHFEIP